MDVKKVGEYIQQKRKAKKLTQKELAEKLSITDRAVSKWERGVCCPDISLLKELSEILDISINEILSGEDIERLEIEKSGDILVETVKEYTTIEKKRNKRLLIFIIILLIFYVGLVFAMYLTYNQVNKNDKLNWTTYSSKKTLDQFFTALENYDYESLRKIKLNSYTSNQTFIGESPIEDEKKCEEYKEMRKNGERLVGPDTICKLKYFEEIGLKFISHKYLYQTYIDGTGEWSTNYDVTIEYQNTKIYFQVGSFVRNGVIANMFGGAKPDQDEPLYWMKFPEIQDNLYSFFNSGSEWIE